MTKLAPKGKTVETVFLWFPLCTGSTLQVTMTSSISDIESDEPSSIFGAKKKKRTKYLRSEDRTILRYLLDDNNYRIIGGNTVWKDMAMLEITNHTWQSMKARFMKYILPNIENYSLSNHNEAKLTGVVKRPAQGEPTDNPTPQQCSPVASTAAPNSPPQVVEFHAAADAHGDMSTDDQLDDFDRLLFANAPDNPTAPEGGATGSTSPWRQDMDKCRNLPSVIAGVNGGVTQRNNIASTRNADNVSAAPKRMQNGDGDVSSVHVPRMRRKRPLEFRTLTKDDDACIGNGASETNVASVPTDDTACYGDPTVQCKVVIGKCPPVDSLSRYRCRIKSSRKQHTRRLRSPDDDELEIVKASTSTETSPQKMVERRLAKTRLMIEAAEDDLPTIATKTKRSRAEQNSNEEGEEKDGEHLASQRDKRRRSSGTIPSPSKGIQSVISFVMSSSDESQQEDAASDDEVETPQQQQERGIAEQEKTVARNRDPKPQVAQNTDGMSTDLKTFDAIVKWLAMSPKDFVDIVLQCDGSVDDAVVFILTGRKKASGSTSHTTESRGDTQRSTATANRQTQSKRRRCRNATND